MFESVFSKIAETFADHRGQKSSWGRWAGSVIIATILFVWAFLCIKQLEWIDMGPYNSLAILGIFVVLAFKSIRETPSEVQAVQPVVIPPVVPSLSAEQKMSEVAYRLADYGVDEATINRILELIQSK